MAGAEAKVHQCHGQASRAFWIPREQIHSTVFQEDSVMQAPNQEFSGYSDSPLSVAWFKIIRLDKEN